ADGGQVSGADGMSGGGAGAFGTVTVTGSGSKLSAADDLYVGDVSGGALDITAGGKVEVVDLVSIGYDGASAMVTVSGAQSSLSTDRDRVVWGRGCDELDSRGRSRASGCHV